MSTSFASDGLANGTAVSSAHALRMRCSVNHAVFCGTSMSRWGLMLLRP